MKNALATWFPAGVSALALAAACSAGSSDGLSGGGSNSGGNGGAGPTTAANTGGTDSQGSFGDTTGTSQQVGCDAGPDEDKDQDGYTINDGDCNDCDANVNPSAIEVIAVDDGMGGGGGAMPADEDCDGEVDNVPEPCDTGIAMDTTDPMDGARSIELCKVADPMNAQDWGVVAAQWVRANGGVASVNYQMGVLPDFGPNVLARGGENMLGISSGAARDLTDPGYCAHSCGVNGAGTAPPNFPQDVPGCPGLTNINDDVGLEVTVRAPSNATGYSFDFRFYSNEYPEWVCTSFNDQFIALVNPAPPLSIDGNISFDSMNNPVSVNVAFFDVCIGCPAGTMELIGTDFFEDEGGTSWLQTTAPIGGGEQFSIRFATWDTGDSAFDSTTLIDNFTWIANGGTVTVGTQPVPE